MLEPYLHHHRVESWERRPGHGAGGIPGMASGWTEDSDRSPSEGCATKYWRIARQIAGCSEQQQLVLRVFVQKMRR